MKLTEKQQEAITPKTNILVEAGAGSGKTTLFVDRYCNLLRENKELKPTQILSLSFTNKAASECLERIYQKIATEASSNPHFKSLIPYLYNAPITTFHGFCKQLLQHYAFYLNISPLCTVLSDDESQFLVKKAISLCIKNALQTDHQAITYYLLEQTQSRLEKDLLVCFKQKTITNSFSKKEIQSFTPLTQALLQLFKEANELYNAEKNLLNALDYEDLIDKTNQLLDIPFIQKKLQDTYHYIMIDECQDTDPLQWDIITKLIDDYDPFKKTKLFLVGDTKQCIYRFRGAKLSFFSELTALFNQNNHTAHVVSLVDNFRTSPHLLTILNPIFKHIFEKTTATLTPFKPLNSQLKSTGSLQTFFLKDTTDEDMEFFAIHTFLKDHIKENETIGILARERQYCEKLFNYLKEKGHPVQTDKQKGFFSQQLIIDCYLLIRVWVYPNDFLSWSSLLQSPFFGFTQRLCQHVLANQEIDLIDKLSNTLSSAISFNEKAINLMNNALTLLTSWKNDKLSSSLSKQLSSVLYSELGINYVKSIPNGEYQIEIFLSLVISLEKKERQTHKSLVDQLAFKLSIHDSAFDMPQSSINPISIMTIHAAKGLEFDTVIVAGCHKAFPLRKASPIIIQDSFCHTSTQDDHDKSLRNTFFSQEEKDVLDEEKRLFYVACTRAKKQLCLTGLYHKNTKKQLFSYLSFLKALPNYQETETSVSFQNNTETIHFPCVFQTPQEKDSNLVIESHNKSLSSVKEPLSVLIKEKIAISDLTAKQNQTLSLTSFQHSLKGTLIHESIMYLLSCNTCSLNQLKQFCISLPNYSLATKAFQDDIYTTLKVLLTSTVISNLKSRNYIFEYPLTYSNQQKTLIGRADAISITSSKTILLEIKTDSCKSIEILLDRYQTQLDYYALCIMNSNNKPIDASLYSSHLDKIITINYTLNDMATLKKTYQLK